MTRPSQEESPKGFLLITTRGHWKKLASAGEWLFDSARAARRLRPGDEAIVYLTAHGGPSAIGGLVLITGEVRQMTRERSSLLQAIYPFALPIEVRVLCEPPIDFASIRPSLSFIPSTAFWGVALQGQPVKEIPRADFELLKQKVFNASSEQHDGPPTR